MHQWKEPGTWHKNLNPALPPTTFPTPAINGLVIDGRELPCAVFKSTYCFFYGTLTRPSILKDVLSLTTDPVLRPGAIHSYELAKWGDYRALIPSEPGSVVTGSAYLVQSAEHASRLAYYETNAYTVTDCLIHFTTEGGPDGKEVGKSAHGKTFIYAGDAEALKQGRFDRELWEARMGRKLPREWRKEGRGNAGCGERTQESKAGYSTAEGFVS